MNTFTEQDMEEYAKYVALARLHNIVPSLEYWYNKPTNKAAKTLAELCVHRKEQLKALQDAVMTFLDTGQGNYHVEFDKHEIRKLCEVLKGGEL